MSANSTQASDIGTIDAELRTTGATGVAGESRLADKLTPYEKLRKEIRSWATWLLVWAGISALTGNVPWGVALAAVAGMAFFFVDTPAMLIIFTGTLASAALWNMLFGGEASWGAFGLLQVLMAVGTYRRYRSFRHARAEHDESTRVDVEAHGSAREAYLPWIALGLSGLGVFGLMLLLAVGVAVGLSGQETVPPVVDMGVGSLLELGALGLPVGLGALVAGKRARAAAIVGMVIGGGVMAIQMLLALAFSA